MRILKILEISLFSYFPFIEKLNLKLKKKKVKKKQKLFNWNFIQDLYINMPQHIAIFFIFYTAFIIWIFTHNHVNACSLTCLTNSHSCQTMVLRYMMPSSATRLFKYQVDKNNLTALRISMVNIKLRFTSVRVLSSNHFVSV